MPYIYRYIDLKKEEVCYIGKITGYKDVWINPLETRHKQHQREQWYKDIGEENVLMQYIELSSHTDADILETWLINQYCQTGQLVNKAKTNWGKSNIDLFSAYNELWKNWGGDEIINRQLIHNRVSRVIDSLLNLSEGLETNLDKALKYFDDGVKDIAAEMKKAHRISLIESQKDFLRVNAEPNT